MSAIAKINNTIPYLTDNGLIIAEYILEKPEEVTRMNVKELAWATKTSPAAIVRFSKRLGYSGFPALKMDLAIDINTPAGPTITAKIPVKVPEDELAHAQALFIQQLQKSFVLIHKDLLQSTITALMNAHHIFLVGSGSLSSLCENFRIKLGQVGLIANHDPDPVQALTLTQHLNQDDVIIILDIYGQQREINQLAIQARDTHTTIISITQARDSILAKYSDVLLSLSSESFDPRYEELVFNQAILMYIDFIILGIGDAQQTKTQ